MRGFSSRLFDPVCMEARLTPVCLARGTGRGNDTTLRELHLKSAGTFTREHPRSRGGGHGRCEVEVAVNLGVGGPIAQGGGSISSGGGVPGGGDGRSSDGIFRRLCKSEMYRTMEFFRVIYIFSGARRVLP